MADLAQEIEDAELQVERAAHALRELDPGNELLKYHFLSAEEVAHGRDPVREEHLRIELKDRFWNGEKPWRETPGAMVAAGVLCHYYFALKQSVHLAAASRGIEAPSLP